MKSEIRNWTGSSHLKINKPCQDRYLIYKKGSTTLSVVADGHGGKMYTRSGLGARIICKVAKDILLNEYNLTDEEIAYLIKIRFDRYIKKHLQLHPLKKWELELCDNKPAEMVYGCTFICCVHTPKQTTCYQIGDGDIFVIDQNGQFMKPMKKDPHCHENITSSMNYPLHEWIQHIRIQHYQNVRAVFLFTDGFAYQNKYPYELIPLLSNDQESLDSLLDTILQKGDHGDDLTFIALYDNEKIQEESFQTGLQKTYQQGEWINQTNYLYKKERQAACYLETALKKLAKMSKNDINYENFRNKIQQKKDEYFSIQEEIAKLLERINHE